ncbi:leucine-rich repeat protein [Butyribacter intestini]|uniref:leucine-rich repeat protein n=1 Tax=Butyribacter intestini TaxID=1703332 RepID=UPI003AF0A407
MKKFYRHISFILILTLCIVPLHAVSVFTGHTPFSDMCMTAKAQTSENIIYLKDGEGEGGNGTLNNPYLNIRTALKNIKDGQTLFLIDTVQYTKYEKGTDGSALPLIINKNITIAGNDTEKSVLQLRAAIQLAADVTFKDMRLQIAPEIILGKSSLNYNTNTTSEILGTEAFKSTAIYVGGHTLTIDNVNTKLDSEAQSKIRPYISGGAYRLNTDNSILGGNTVVNIINANAETKFADIYAGDYFKSRNIPATLNLSGKFLDSVVHCGGYSDSSILNSDVDINLYADNPDSAAQVSGITGFDTANHNGKVNVTLTKNVFSSSMSLNDIDCLKLDNNSRINFDSSNIFDVKNVILGNNTILDFRQLTGNPAITETLLSLAPADDTQKNASILLNNKQTLRISGNVTGTTRLNVVDTQEIISNFNYGHTYVTSSQSSDGTFSIDGTKDTFAELKTEIEDNIKKWSIYKKSGSESNDTDFKSFEITDGPDIIYPTEFYHDYSYKLKFINKNDETYIPDNMNVRYNLEYQIIKDGKVIFDSSDNTDDDNTVYPLITLETTQSDENDENSSYETILAIETDDVAKLKNIYGNYSIVLSYFGNSITKNIRIADPLETAEPTTKPTPTPTIKPTTAPTTEPINTPTTKPTAAPTTEPTNTPTTKPTVAPTAKPANTSQPPVTPVPAPAPTDNTAPTAPPSDPDAAPTSVPTNVPSVPPTVVATSTPSISPTVAPTNSPSDTPTVAPTSTPSVSPTVAPTKKPASVKTKFSDKKSGIYFKISNSSKKYLEYLYPTSSKTNIVIPNTVKYKNKSYKVVSVAPKAFYNKSKLKKVCINANITTLGKDCFAKCKKLNSITFKGSKPPKIGRNAFKNINKKAKFYVPKKAYAKYRKTLTSKTGFNKSMKIVKK